MNFLSGLVGGIMLLTLLVHPGVITAQYYENEPSKQDKKEARVAREQEVYLELKNAVADSAFILSAHTLFDRYGRSYILSPNTNFVLVDGDRLVVQLSFNNLVGWNGLGGITMEGKITNYKNAKNKKNKKDRGINLQLFAIGSSMGNATINMNGNLSGQMRATLTDNFGNRITFSGNLNPLDRASYFKGSTTY